MVDFKLTEEIRGNICVKMLLIGIDDQWKYILRDEIAKPYFRKVSLSCLILVNISLISKTFGFDIPPLICMHAVHECIWGHVRACASVCAYENILAEEWKSQYFYIKLSMASSCIGWEIGFAKSDRSLFLWKLVPKFNQRLIMTNLY